MVSNIFSKKYFIFSKDSKPVDYRGLTPFANFAGLSDIEEYAINKMEEKILKSIISLPPVEQKIEMKDVATFYGKSKRFINSIFFSMISEKNNIIPIQKKIQPSNN